MTYPLGIPPSLAVKSSQWNASNSRYFGRQYMYFKIHHFVYCEVRLALKIWKHTFYM